MKSVVMSTGRNIDEKLRRFATVLADSNDAVTVIELDGRISAWNRGAERLYGYSEAEALGMRMDRLIPEEKKDETRAFMQQLIDGEMVESLETKRRAKDGRVLDVWLTVTRLVDDSGKTTSIATTERDVTDKKRKESELQRTINDLTKAMEEIQTLKGLLPICSACKKIRDDQGYWQEVEAYIGKHAKVRFSHSICPECGKKLYPEYVG